MKYNPKVSANCNSPQHHRRSIRLKGYDYSQSGLYFITICCQNRAHLFGEIIDGEMVLNEGGKMVEHWYYKLENKFNDIECCEMVVMPNHFHCIIEIVNDNDLRGCEMDAQIHIPIDDDVGARRGRPMCLPNDSKTGLPCYNMGVSNKFWSPLFNK